jgi:hypothetical protein
MLAIGGSWLAFGRDAVSRAEVDDLVALHSPYAIDRAGIQTRLAAITDDHVLIENELRLLQSEISSDERQIAVLNERLRKGPR